MANHEVTSDQRRFGASLGSVGIFVSALAWVMTGGLVGVTHLIAAAVLATVAMVVFAVVYRKYRPIESSSDDVGQKTQDSP